MTEPKPGDKATCKNCGRKIVYERRGDVFEMLAWWHDPGRAGCTAEPASVPPAEQPAAVELDEDRIADLLVAEMELNELHSYLDQIGCLRDPNEDGDEGPDVPGKPIWENRGHASNRIGPKLRSLTDAVARLQSLATSQDALRKRLETMLAGWETCEDSTCNAFALEVRKAIEGKP